MDTPSRSPAAVLSLALVFAGCAAPTLNNDPTSEARRALAALAVDYQNADAESFLQRFDRASFPQADAFYERVRDFLLRNRQVTIDLITDAVLQDGEAIVAQLHWNRSFVNEAGAYKLESGRCEIFFRQRPSGGLLVTGISGSSPF